MSQEFVDEYDFVNPDIARCPKCGGGKVLLVDEKDEIYFCPDDKLNKGCGWSGKEVELNFI